MSKTISTADLFDEPINVELWGAEFRLRERTRSVEEKLEAKQSEFARLDEGVKGAEAVALLGEMLDILLEPLGGEGGKKVHAKTVIKKQYEADVIGINNIERLFERLAEKSQERPT